MLFWGFYCKAKISTDFNLVEGVSFSEKQSRSTATITVNTMGKDVEKENS